MAKLSEVTATEMTWQEGSAPTTPASTKWKEYFKSDGKYVMDDAGVETGPLGVGGGGGFTETVNDPLTSLSNLTTGSGTWSLNTYAQVVATTAQCRAYHTTPVPWGSVTVVECEVEVPASGFSTSGHHIRVGMAEGDVVGNVTFGIRGDNKAYVEDDGQAAVTNVAYTVPAAGTWVKLRLVSNGIQHDGYIDGTRYISLRYVNAGTNGPTSYAYVVAYGAFTTRFRNLKAWALTLPA